MRKVLWTTVLCALLIGALWAKETVKIGIILPLTGDISSYGEALRDVALLKERELQASNLKYQYQFIIEDNNTQTKTALLAANRLVSLDHVDFLVGFWGDYSMAALPIAQRAGIPHMAILPWNTKAVGHSPLNCAIASSAEAETELILDTAKKLGYRRIAIIYQRAFDAEEAIIALRQSVKEKNMQLVAEVPFNEGERDFLPYLWKIKDSKPDLMINLAISPEIFIIEKQFKEMGLKCDVTTYDGDYDGYENNEYIQGHWYIACAAPSAEFSKKYGNMYHRSPEYGTGFMYDGLSLIVRAYEESSVNGQKPSAQKVAAWLRNVHGIQGAVGELNCDSRGFIDTQPRLMRIDHGKGVPTTAEELLKLKAEK